MMQCPKCGGRMNFEEFVSVGSGEMPWSYEGWRCVYCGQIIDPLILLNRKQSKIEAEEEAPVSGGRGRR